MVEKSAPWYVVDGDDKRRARLNCMSHLLGLVPYERIELQLQEGPFRRLHGIWQFLALRDDASKVSLRMEFEFSGRLINLAFGPVFSHIADSLVEAFSKRAREVYSDR